MVVFTFTPSEIMMKLVYRAGGSKQLVPESAKPKDYDKFAYGYISMEQGEVIFVPNHGRLYFTQLEMRNIYGFMKQGKAFEARVNDPLVGSAPV